MSHGILSGKPGKFITGLRKHYKRDPYRVKTRKDYFRDGQRLYIREKKHVRMGKAFS